MDTVFLKQVKYKGENAYLFLIYYTDGKKGLMLNPTNNPEFTQESYILTSNINGTLLNEVAVNDHDHHKGNLEFLVKEEVLRFCGYEQSGWVSYPLGKFIFGLEKEKMEKMDVSRLPSHFAELIQSIENGEILYKEVERKANVGDLIRCKDSIRVSPYSIYNVYLVTEESILYYGDLYEEATSPNGDVLKLDKTEYNVLEKMNKEEQEYYSQKIIGYND